MYGDCTTPRHFSPLSFPILSLTCTASWVLLYSFTPPFVELVRTTFVMILESTPFLRITLQSFTTGTGFECSYLRYANWIMYPHFYPLQVGPRTSLGRAVDPTQSPFPYETSKPMVGNKESVAKVLLTWTFTGLFLHRPGKPLGRSRKRGKSQQR